MGIFDFTYTAEERGELDALRSRLNVANAMLDARLKLGMSQADVGGAAGTKQSRVSDIESMRGNLRFDTLDRLAMVVGLMVTLVPRPNALPVTTSTQFRTMATTQLSPHVRASYRPLYRPFNPGTTYAGTV